MSEAILAKDWLPQVELAFEKLKVADTAEREEFCEIIREDEGPEAERELRAKLAAHDQAMQAQTKPKPLRNGLRRDLNRANAAPLKLAPAPLRDTLDVAAKPLNAREAASPAIEPTPSTALVPITPKPEPLELPEDVAKLDAFQKAKYFARHRLSHSSIGPRLVPCTPAMEVRSPTADRQE